MSKRIFSGFLFAAFVLTGPALPSYASSGMEGAAFLDIPVGAGPAALGAAYTPLANDAYAATWNPGGLGFLDSTQFSGQHLSYLESLHYEYLSFAVPLPRKEACVSLGSCPASSIGGSIQYLGTGDMTGRDDSGALTGSYSSYYASYNLAYGRSFNDKLSLGLTGKLISARIDDVSANAFAMDFGSFYRFRRDLTLAATLTNAGSKLKFLSDGDSLPLALHLGAAYQPNLRWLVTSEVVVPKTGLASFHLGGEWRPIEMLTLRSGFRTDTLKGLSFLAGYSLGIGLNVWGQDVSYAWLPYGELGTTHYFSLLMRFGESERSKRNLIQYQHIKPHRTAGKSSMTEETPDYQQLMEILNEGSAKPVVQEQKKSGGSQ